jgi:hypothetical protein
MPGLQLSFVESAASAPSNATSTSGGAEGQRSAVIPAAIRHASAFVLTAPKRDRNYGRGTFMDQETISDDEIRDLEHKLEGIIPDAQRAVVSLTGGKVFPMDRARILILHLLGLGDLASRLLEVWKVGSRGHSQRGCQEGSDACGAADAAGAAGLGNAVLDAPGAEPTSPSGRLLVAGLERWMSARSVEAGQPRGKEES